MNLLGYDAMALGEGDLGILGLDAIQDRIEEANFPVLSANVLHTETGELLAKPYVIREIAGLRFAIIGLTGPAELPAVEIRDPVESLRDVLDAVRDRADVLILLSHAGLAANRQIADQFPELALIISGGGSAVTASPERDGDGPAIVHADLASPGHAGRKLGVGTWYFDPRGELIEGDWVSLPLTPEIVDDPAMLEWTRQHS